MSPLRARMVAHSRSRLRRFLCHYPFLAGQTCRLSDVSANGTVSVDLIREAFRYSAPCVSCPGPVIAPLRGIEALQTIKNNRIDNVKPGVQGGIACVHGLFGLAARNDSVALKTRAVRIRAAVPAHRQCPSGSPRICGPIPFR